MIKEKEFKQKIIRKSRGINKAEEYLTKLCEKTFLSMWGYANVYRKPGKELCDFLVVFGNHIIIFSDKDCQFKINGDIDKAWARWFKKAVKSPVEDLWGAERWINNYPEKISLDSRCREKYPYPLPGIKKAKFHLVVVTHGISVHCKKLFGGSGSLMFCNDINSFSKHKLPFTIGDFNPLKSFVHVLDDTSLDILMETRDTVYDFVNYIQKREKFLRSKKKIFVSGEEELLAIYLKNINKEKEHDFIFPDENFDGIAITEGHWENFKKSKQRIVQIKDDKISYFWDKLIERFNKHILTGTQEYANPTSISSLEKVTRFMAAQPRFIRRELAKNFLEILKNTPEDKRVLRVVPPWRDGDPYFVFLIFPFKQDKSYNDNRTIRINFLGACCRVVKLKYPEAKDIVGIATESGRIDRGEGSEDACYLDTRIWTEKNKENAKKLQAEFKILENSQKHKLEISEYPE